MNPELFVKRLRNVRKFPEISSPSGKFCITVMYLGTLNLKSSWTCDTNEEKSRWPINKLRHSCKNCFITHSSMLVELVDIASYVYTGEPTYVEYVPKDSE